MMLDRRFVVAGGGPAGIMLGYLLARAGHTVTVLEKHADFFRDFRGDTIHPSTLGLMDELGLLDAFLQVPHNRVRAAGAEIGGETFQLADLRYLRTRCKFIALMPQWDFLNFLSAEAKRFPAFELRMETRVVDLLTEGERVVGVVTESPRGRDTIRAGLVVGADGRHSDVRRLAGLRVRDIGAPIDALWLRVSRKPSDPGDVLGRIARGSMLVMLDRFDYWQCAYIIRKGAFDAMKREGIQAFQQRLLASAPFLGERVEEISDWDRVSQLTVTIDRLERWYREGLLCIGDAAHAMSPVGGIGINLAIQDAVATANRLCRPTIETFVSLATLSAIQKRRTLPTVLTQALQVAVQENAILPALESTSTEKLRAPWPVRLVDRLPLLQAIPAYVIGIGFRPEKVRSPKAR